VDTVIRIPILLLLSSLVVGLTSCEEEGELRIRNRTASDVWVSADGRPPHQLEAESNWSLYYEQERTVTLSYNGNYVFPNTLSRLVRLNLVTTADIVPDGGVVRLLNDSATGLTEVYISSAGDPNWGEDDLAGTLLPGENALWTVTAGLWDIRVGDAEANYHYLYDQAVETNMTLELSLSAFGRSDQKTPSKQAESVAINRLRTENWRFHDS